MEFALSTSTTTTTTSVLFSRLSRHLHSPHVNRRLHNQLVYRRLKTMTVYNSRSSCSLNSLKDSSSIAACLPWGLCGSGGAVRSPIGTPVRCASRTADSFALGSGGSGGRGESGGFGGDGSGGRSGGDAKAHAVAGGAEEVTGVMPDVIILDVEGMTCGGCAASVKRILESQPQVSSASVNLTTETAVIWPKSEAKVIPNWQKELGEVLAKHLTTCGFKSNPRGRESVEGDIS